MHTKEIRQETLKILDVREFMTSKGCSMALIVENNEEQRGRFALKGDLLEKFWKPLDIAVPGDYLVVYYTGENPFDEMVKLELCEG